MVSINVLLPTKWPSHPQGNAHVDMFEALAKKLETLMNDKWLLSSVQPSTVLSDDCNVWRWVQQDAEVDLRPDKLCEQVHVPDC